MGNKAGSRMSGWFLVPVLIAACWGTLDASTLVKTNDRKFPLDFCPLETRGTALDDFTFTATGPAARITFSVPNASGICSVDVNGQSAPCRTTEDDCAPFGLGTCEHWCYPGQSLSCVTDADCPAGDPEHPPLCGRWNALALDNVVVVQRDLFLADRVSPVPAWPFFGCYSSTPPPGQTTGGSDGAPFYDQVAGTSEVYTNLFDSPSTLGGWAGQIYHDDLRFAPRDPNPADGSSFDETGGSLGVGAPSDGSATVSASVVVSGLTSGQDYVVSAWWTMAASDTMTMTIDTSACLDGDGDGYVDCGSCNPDPGQICGDCNDADPAIHPGVPDATCNGIDDNCDGLLDDEFPGGCLCTLAPAGLLTWLPGNGDALDVRGGLAGTPVNGATFSLGRVDQAFSLDGVDDAVDGIGSTATFAFLENTGVFTIAAWINLNDAEALLQQAITGTTGTTIENGHFFLWENSGGQKSLRLGLMKGVDGVPVIDTSAPAGAISSGTWHHVAAVGDGAHVTFYVDGVGAVGTGVMGAFATGGTSRALSLGRCPASVPSCQLGGRIDEVQIWDRALSGTEIRALFDAGSVPLCRCVDEDFDGYQLGDQGLTCSAGTQADCDDTSAAISPAATELCNGIDDDCDGVFDDGLPQSVFHRDADGDAYGSDSVTIQSCAAPAGYLIDGSDCDDANAAIHPGATDAICDGIDQNCSGTADEQYVSPPEGWIATPLDGAPAARRYHTMVSTGDRIVVWGGSGTGGALNTGGRYDPATETWLPTSTDPSSVPAGRQLHSAVWAPERSEMIVWGGVVASGASNTGGRYDPTNDTWSPVSTTGAPAGRNQHTAVWTGSKMIIWGGTLATTNTGGVYDPAVPPSGGWSDTSTTGAPEARFAHTAVWDPADGYMVVWGGSSAVPLPLASGGRYRESDNSWLSVHASPLSARYGHTAVWTGSAMIVWGGFDGGTYFGDGAVYFPGSDSWFGPIATGPPGRYHHRAVWDPVAGKMVIYGGFGVGGIRNDAWAYDPVTNTWSQLSTIGAPQGRYDHAAAWLASTGDLVVWGGSVSGAFTSNTGGRVVVATFDCGVGACNASSAYTCTSGQLGYGCTPGVPTAEICNGIDDDCDGTIDDGAGPPAGDPAVVAFDTVFETGSVVAWSAVQDATGYDVVYGSLSTLLGTGGNFAVATLGCLGDDLPDLSVAELATPAPGDAIWHLVRAVNACGAGSYGGVPRDVGIAASPMPCP